jgi:hypothetical protein
MSNTITLSWYRLIAPKKTRKNKRRARKKQKKKGHLTGPELHPYPKIRQERRVVRIFGYSDNDFRKQDNSDK